MAFDKGYPQVVLSNSAGTPYDPTTPLPVSASQAPSGAVHVTSSSGNQAAANAVATLPGIAAKTTWLTGFELTSAGSTAAGVVTVTITGTISGTLSYTYTTVAGATLANNPLIVSFVPPIPASAVNTPIVVTLPSLGAGNTNATAVAHGFTV